MLITGIDGVGEIDAFEMLEMLDVDNVHPVGLREAGFSCIFTERHPFGDQNPSCHMNRHTGAWRCKSCHRTGGLIDFVGSARHCSPMEALRWLRINFGETLLLPASSGGIVDEVRSRLSRRYEDRPADEVIDEASTIGPGGIFHVDWSDDSLDAVSYMVGARGLDREVLARAGVGWDSWTSRVVLPYRNIDGDLVGFNARSLSDNHSRRYMVLGDDAVKEPRYGVGYGFKMMRVERHLFGLHEALRALEGRPWEQRELIVVEGEINRLTIAERRANVVSSGNAALFDEQLRLLRQHCSSAVLYFDPDEAGEGAVWGDYDSEKDRNLPGIVEQLSPFMALRVVGEHKGDANDVGSEQAVALIDEAKPWLRAMIE